MHLSNATEANCAMAVVEHVDLVNRELVLNIRGMSHVVDVPPYCDVLLRGEPVKLRLLQPADRVRITWRWAGDEPVATKIEVKPEAAYGRP